jgi:hypothetical protein
VCIDLETALATEMPRMPLYYTTNKTREQSPLGSIVLDPGMNAGIGLSAQARPKFDFWLWPKAEVGEDLDLGYNGVCPVESPH